MIYKILSIDGGGTRALVALEYLKEIESQTGKRILDMFDLFCGTSSGSITAAAISYGLSLEEIEKLYLEKSRGVFLPWYRVPFNKIKRWPTEGFSNPTYEGKRLEKMLLSVFKNDKLSSLHKKTLFTVYNVSRNKEGVIKSDKHDMRILDAVKASSSVPGFFPAHVIGDEAFVDGAFVANNPSLCGIAEAMRVHEIPKGEIVAVSVGTGNAESQISANKAKKMGPLQWGTKLITLFLDGSEDSIDYISKTIIGDNYNRFQVKVDSGISFTDARPKMMKKLQESVRNNDLYYKDRISELKSVL